MTNGQAIISLIGDRQDLDQFRKKTWTGSFEEYLDLVRHDSRVTRNSYERLYDMILSYGVEPYHEGREKRVRYKFFDDPEDHGKDAVFGLDVPLRNLVFALKSAAQGYGIERRVLLLQTARESERAIRLNAEVAAMQGDAFYIERLYTRAWRVAPEGAISLSELNAGPSYAE